MSYDLVEFKTKTEYEILSISLRNFVIEPELSFLQNDILVGITYLKYSQQNIRAIDEYIGRNQLNNDIPNFNTIVISLPS